MARSERQKLKLLVMADMFREHTDDDHILSTAEIIERLQKVDIAAERKSIYHDIDCLCEYGLDIVKTKRKGIAGYYLASREFEMPELKLLIDSVQASRFITIKKSRQLINKLTSFSSKYQSEQLDREVFVGKRIKSENESVYYNVDKIFQCISNNRTIRFQYAEWNIHKELELKKGGQKYEISPWKLAWHDDNYYLIGYDAVAEVLKHYRVDKMKSIDEGEQVRSGLQHYQNFDLAEYCNKTFHMFHGTDTRVSLQIKSELIGVLLDRFGRQIQIIDLHDGNLEAQVVVSVSNQFFGWLSGFGDDMKLLGPSPLVEEYLMYLQKIGNQYL